MSEIHILRAEILGVGTLVFHKQERLICVQHLHQLSHRLIENVELDLRIELDKSK